MKKVVPAGGDRHRAPVETPLVCKQDARLKHYYAWIKTIKCIFE